MARARNGSMTRGLSGQNTNPIALAPASAAAIASSTRVTPQIFTNIVRSLDDLELRHPVVLGASRVLTALRVLRVREQRGEPRVRLRRGHQLLADQERPISERAEPREIGSGLQTALAHGDDV